MTSAGSRPVLVSAMAFASCYVYSPSAKGKAAARSRSFCAQLKEGGVALLAECAARVRAESETAGPFAEFFQCTSILVPVPGSAPESSGSPWAAACVAEALAREGLGAGVRRALARTLAVRRSATAPAGARPTIAQHFASMAWVRDADAPDDIVLVDDVVTKGRTFLAAANCVRSSLPHARVRGFALLRTMGFMPGIERLFDPCVGEIRLRGGEAHRSP